MRAPPPTPAAVSDTFDLNKHFDLSTRAGSSAYTTISASLDNLKDGNVSTFPSFIVELCLRAEEGKWNTAAPQVILEIDTTFAGAVVSVTKNILTDYHSVTDA